MTINTFMG